MSEEVTGSVLDAPVEEETPKFTLITGKPHISFSELKDWNDCSFRHKLKHVDKINVFRPSYHLAFGTAVHAALEHYLKTREMKPEIAYEQLDKLWRPEYARAEPKEKDFSLDKLKLQATEILADVPEFLEKNFPGWRLIDAERALYEAINAKGAKFKGFIDCIIAAPDAKGKEKVWILDWKTSGSGWTPMKKREPLLGLQLTLYKKFWMDQVGTAGEEVPALRDVRCGFVILKRRPKPGKKCELMKVSVGEVTLTRALKIVSNMLASMERNVFLKNRNNCTWCDFKGSEHCP
jgi:hypothetical protein